eukprot:3884188-Amphidinium_carterae.1
MTNNQTLPNHGVILSCQTVQDIAMFTKLRVTVGTYMDCLFILLVGSILHSRSLLRFRSKLERFGGVVIASAIVQNLVLGTREGGQKKEELRISLQNVELIAFAVKQMEVVSDSAFQVLN